MADTRYHSAYGHQHLSPRQSSTAGGLIKPCLIRSSVFSSLSAATSVLAFALILGLSVGHAVDFDCTSLNPTFDDAGHACIERSCTGCCECDEAKEDPHPERQRLLRAASSEVGETNQPTPVAPMRAN